MREITAGELCKILEEHERWCDTGKKEGEKADLSGANLSGADLRSDFLPRANLIAANLSDADLRGACLEDADLYRADLYRADLMAANLSGANLSEVLGLNIEQLSTVETLYEAELDPELMEQVRKKYPHLLEEPEYEE